MASTRKDILPDRFSVRPTISKTHDFWVLAQMAFSSHFTEIDLSLLLLDGREAKSPEYINPCI